MNQPVTSSLIPYWNKLCEQFHQISSEDETLLVYMDEQYYAAMVSWLQEEYNVVEMTWRDGPRMAFANQEDLVRFKLTWA